MDNSRDAVGDTWHTTGVYIRLHGGEAPEVVYLHPSHDASYTQENGEQS